MKFKLLTLIVFLTIGYLVPILENDVGLMAYAQNPCQTDPHANCDVNGRVIYGTDDRRDWFEMDEGEQQLARSSVSLFSEDDVLQISDTHVKLRTISLKGAVGLCDDGKEAFADQRTGAFCSGVLVAKNKVLTAGHCLRELSANSDSLFTNEIKFVFGFAATNERPNGVTKLPLENVFTGKLALNGELSDDGADWGLLQLDRDVPASLAKPIVNISPTEVKRDQKVAVIGYPTGLPLKYAPNAEIRDAENKHFFVANLDTYGGNSGSPVYDQETKTLVGILVRGETDYVPCKKSQCYRLGTCNCKQVCMRSNVCPTTGCRGEEVMRISEIVLQ